MFVDLSVGTDEEFSRFEQFINQFMARDESRILNAKTLVTDFGVESSFYKTVLISLYLFSKRILIMMQKMIHT